MEKFIAAELKELRQKNGWSKKDIALLTNVTEETVTDWEDGTSEPDLSQWIILAKFYQTNEAHAFGEDMAINLMTEEAKEEFETKLQANEMLKMNSFN